MHTTTSAPPSRGSIGRHHGEGGGGVVGLLFLWIGRRRQRRALAALDDHLLRDLGLTRDEADRESRKPFWRR